MGRRFRRRRALVRLCSARRAMHRARPRARNSGALYLVEGRVASALAHQPNERALHRVTDIAITMKPQRETKLTIISGAITVFSCASLSEIIFGAAPGTKDDSYREDNRARRILSSASSSRPPAWHVSWCCGSSCITKRAGREPETGRRHPRCGHDGQSRLPVQCGRSAGTPHRADARAICACAGAAISVSCRAISPSIMRSVLQRRSLPAGARPRLPPW